jgi:hypothetical protein
VIYLETERSRTEALSTSEDIARQVMVLLADGEPWVKCVASSGDETIWTVLDRNSTGRPVNLAYQDFEGGTGIMRF